MNHKGTKDTKEEFFKTEPAGKYASTEEVVMTAIKLLENQERIYKGRFDELFSRSYDWSRAI